MLLRSIIGYAPSNLVPALAGIMTIIVFSRLLPPDELGRYAVAQSLVVIGQALAFYGLQVSVTRFYPRHLKAGSVARLLASAYACYLACAAAVGGLVTAGILALAPEPALAGPLWLALPTLLLRGLVTVNLAAHRGALHVGRYNLVECGQSATAFALALVLVTGFGLGASGLMLGLLCAACFALLPDLRLMARNIGRPDRAILREMRTFGGPLVLCYALNSTQAYADRFFLERLAGASAVGLYAVATGIVDRAVSLIFMAVTLGAFPLAIDRLERHGVAAARDQLRANVTALMALAVPAAVGLACTADLVATVLVGPAYRAGVIAIIPLIALLSFLRGMTVHYFDHALHLGCRSDLFLYTVGPAAALSLVLNPLLIPWLGLMGAIQVALATQALALGSTIVIGRRVFPIGFPFGQAARIGLASTAMAGALGLIHPPESIIGLTVGVAVGAGIYTAVGLALDVAHVRSWLITLCDRGARGAPTRVGEGRA
jgi:O-antigen/teichoic acid export membrane protein